MRIHYFIVKMLLKFYPRLYYRYLSEYEDVQVNSFIEELEAK